MKLNRPSMKVEQVKKFFEQTETSSQKSKKYAAAAFWFLDQGQIRVWDPEQAKVNVWVKQAILAYFSSNKSTSFGAGCFEYFDKIPLKKRTTLKNVRVVPGAIVRAGSFIESGAILMPCFINVGAYVGKNTMVDTWATVGSCAQIGANVHLSGGVGIGGVLEPAQASPVVIEEGAFIGSRCIIVEGVRVGREAVLGAGVTLTASTKIIDVRGEKPITSTGFIPERSVVIPGSYPKKFGSETFHVPCALIIGTRTQATDLKTSLNAVLRQHEVSV